MSIPRPVPRDQRQLRNVNCRRCGHESETAGTSYCDGCRAERLSDDLMSPADWAREAQLQSEGSGS